MVLPNQKAEAPRWLTQRLPDDWVRQLLAPIKRKSGVRRPLRSAYRTFLAPTFAWVWRRVQAMNKIGGGLRCVSI